MQISTYRLEFPRVGLTTTVEFSLNGVDSKTIDKAWDHEIFPKNLPAFRITPSPRKRHPDISLYVARRAANRLAIRLPIGEHVVKYSTLSSEFSEDLFKIVLQNVASKSALSGLVLFHASALATQRGAILIPGPSGTGKSTTALWWMSSDRPVIASETAVVSSAGVHDGNPLLSIKHSTADRFLGTNLPEPSYKSGEYLLFSTPPFNPLPVPIEGVVFVKLTEAESKVREIPISPRRASMKLYEAAHWIAVGGFLLGGSIMLHTRY